MFGEIVRKHSQFFLKPMARFFSVLGISPNMLTIVGFLLMVGVAWVLASGKLLLGGLLIIAVVLLDAIDGAVARLTNQATRFGAFLDSTLDRFSEAALFLGLFIYFVQQSGYEVELILIYVAIVGSMMVSYARARAEAIGVPLKDGLLTRFERIFILCTGLIAQGVFSLIIPDWSMFLLTIALWMLAILSNFTAFQRMYLVWQAIGHEQGHQ